MELIRYHTVEGYRHAVIVKEGRRYLHLAIVGEPRLKKIDKSEARYFVSLGEPTKTQIRIINRAARRAGYSKRRPLLGGAS